MLGDLENQERNHRNIQGLHYAFITSGQSDRTSVPGPLQEPNGATR
jgi:hypothetical protein